MFVKELEQQILESGDEMENQLNLEFFHFFSFFGSNGWVVDERL